MPPSDAHAFSHRIEVKLKVLYSYSYSLVLVLILVLMALYSYSYSYLWDCTRTRTRTHRIWKSGTRTRHFVLVLILVLRTLYSYSYSRFCTHTTSLSYNNRQDLQGRPLQLLAEEGWHMYSKNHTTVHQTVIYSSQAVQWCFSTGFHQAILAIITGRTCKADPCNYWQEGWHMYSKNHTTVHLTVIYSSQAVQWCFSTGYHRAILAIITGRTCKADPCNYWQEGWHLYSKNHTSVHLTVIYSSQAVQWCFSTGYHRAILAIITGRTCKADPCNYWQRKGDICTVRTIPVYI